MPNKKAKTNHLRSHDALEAHLRTLDRQQTRSFARDLFHDLQVLRKRASDRAWADTNQQGQF